MTRRSPKIIADALTLSAARLNIPPDQVNRAMRHTKWRSVRGMFDQEFNGPYYGYTPTCGMHVFEDAVIAEVFDALALGMKDKRRAVRQNQILKAQSKPSCAQNSSVSD